MFLARSNKPRCFVSQNAMWPVSEQRMVYRKNPVVRPGPLNARYQPYSVPRYQFTARDLDHCLYGKQDLQVICHIYTR